MDGAQQATSRCRTHCANASDNATEGFAGDPGRGSANPEWSELRNSLAHLPVPPTLTEVAQNGGELAASGGEVHG